MSITVERARMPGPPLVAHNSVIVTADGNPVPFILQLGTTFASNIDRWPAAIGRIWISAYLWVHMPLGQWFATIVFLNDDVHNPMASSGDTFRLKLPNGQYDESQDDEIKAALREAFWTLDP